MKLPVIKHLSQFIEDYDADYLVETIEVLESLTEVVLSAVDVFSTFLLQDKLDRIINKIIKCLMLNHFIVNITTNL